MDNESGFTLAGLFPLPTPEGIDMTALMDIMYLLTTPLFGLMFALLVFFSKRSLTQNDEAWKTAHKKFDKLVDKIELLAEKTIASETRLQMHINDKAAHTYGRRDDDV